MGWLWLGHVPCARPAPWKQDRDPTRGVPEEGPRAGRKQKVKKSKQLRRGAKAWDNSLGPEQRPGCKADTHATSAVTEVPLNSHANCRYEAAGRNAAESEELEKYNGVHRSRALEANNCGQGVSTLPRQNRKVSTPAMVDLLELKRWTSAFLQGLVRFRGKIGRSVHPAFLVTSIFLFRGIFGNQREARAVMLWIAAGTAAILPDGAEGTVASQGAVLENTLEEVDNFWWAALCVYLLVVHLLAGCTMVRWSCTVCRWTCRAASRPRREAGMPTTSGGNDCTVLLRRFTVVQLRHELRARSIPVTGLKDDLITRLQGSMPFASGKQLALIGRLLTEDSRLAATLALSDLTSTGKASLWIDAALKLKRS
jgi:hypothetical protein